VRAWCVCAGSDAKTRFLVPWHPTVAATNKLMTDLLPTREVPCAWPAPALAGWYCYLGIPPLGPSGAHAGPCGPMWARYGRRSRGAAGSDWPQAAAAAKTKKNKNQKNTNASCRFARVCQCRKEVVHLRIVLFTWPHIESVGTHTAMTGLAGAAAFASVSEGSAPACCPSCCSWSFCSSCCPALTPAAM